MIRANTDRLAMQVQQKYIYLQNLIQSEVKLEKSEEIVSSVKTQGSFSRVRLPDTQMEAMSLNTFKKYADQEIDGGFAEVDRIRKQVLAKYRNALSVCRPKSKRHVDIQRQIQQANRQLPAMQDSVMVLTYCFKRSLELWRTAVGASNLQAEVARCQKEQAELLKLLSQAGGPDTMVPDLENVIQLKKL